LILLHKSASQFNQGSSAGKEVTVRPAMLGINDRHSPNLKLRLMVSPSSSQPIDIGQSKEGSHKSVGNLAHPPWGGSKKSEQG